MFLDVLGREKHLTLDPELKAARRWRIVGLEFPVKPKTRTSFKKYRFNNNGC
jgi:hypothetical protein